MSRSPIVDLRGRAAYKAYFDAVGGRSVVSGDPLPFWDQMESNTREAWRAAADAAVMITELRDDQ